MKNNRAIQCLSLYSVYFLCLLIVFSCSPDPKIPVYGDFPTEVAEIFANKCATSGCHNDASYKCLPKKKQKMARAHLFGIVDYSIHVLFVLDIHYKLIFFNTRDKG